MDYVTVRMTNSNVGKTLGSEMPPVRYVDVSNICVIWNVKHITLITQIRFIAHYL